MTTRPGQQKNIPAMGRTAGFGRVRRAVRRRAKAVVLMPVLFAAATAAIVFLLPDRYEALVTLEVDPQPATVNSMTGETDDKAQQRALDEEIDVLRSAAVVRRVVRELELGADNEFAMPFGIAALERLLRPLGPETIDTDAEAQFADHLTVYRVRNTLLLGLRFAASDPKKAALIANAVADAYLEEKVAGSWPKAIDIKAATDAASSVARQDDDRLSPSERAFESMVAQYATNSQRAGARIIDRAQPPRWPSGPKRKELIESSAVAGLMLALALALLLEVVAASDANARDVEEAFGCRHVTSVPTIEHTLDRSAADGLRLVLAEPEGRYADAIDAAAAEIDRQRRNASTIILVASALPGEGAEVFASNLAHDLAIKGQPALLVDGDLRLKVLTRRLAGPCARGLLDQIASRRAVDDAVLYDGTTGLHFMPASGAAPIPLSPSSALRSTEFAEALARLRERFSTIVISAPPLLPVSDARVMAGLADQIVFVTDWKKTPRRLAKKALALLSPNRSKVVGAVLMDVGQGGEPPMMSIGEILDEIRRTTQFGAQAA